MTTGLGDQMIFPHLETIPKVLSKRGAERSDDFVKIPELREPFKPNKKIERFNKKLEKFKGSSKRNKSMGIKKFVNTIVQ